MSQIEIFRSFEQGFISKEDVDTSKVTNNALARVENFEINKPLFSLAHTSGFEDYVDIPLPIYSGGKTIAHKMWSVEHPEPREILLVVRKSNNLLTLSNQFPLWENAFAHPDVFLGSEVEIDGALNHHSWRFEATDPLTIIRDIDYPKTYPVGTQFHFSVWYNSEENVPTVTLADGVGTSSNNNPLTAMDTYGKWKRLSVTRTMMSADDHQVRITIGNGHTVELYGAHLQIVPLEEIPQSYGYTVNAINPTYIFMFPKWNGEEWVEEWDELTEGWAAISGDVANDNRMVLNTGVPVDHFKGYQLRRTSGEMLDRTICGNTQPGTFMQELDLISDGVGALHGVEIHRSPAIVEEELTGIEKVNFTQGLNRLYITFGSSKRPFVVYYHDQSSKFEGVYPEVKRFVMDYQTHFFPIITPDRALAGSRYERFGMYYECVESDVVSSVKASGRIAFVGMEPEPPGMWKPINSYIYIKDETIGIDLASITPSALASAISLIDGITATSSGNREDGEVIVEYDTEGSVGNTITFMPEDHDTFNFHGMYFIPWNNKLSGGVDGNQLSADTYHVFLVVTLENGTKLFYRESEGNSAVDISENKTIKVNISFEQAGLLSRIRDIDVYVGKGTDDHVQMFKEASISPDTSGWSVDDHRLTFEVLIGSLISPEQTTTLMQDVFRNPNLEVRARYDYLHYLRGRIFVGGIRGKINYIRFTNIRGTVEELDIFPYSEPDQYGFIYTDPGNANPIVGLSETLDGNLMVFRRNQTSIYEVSTGREFQRRFFTLFENIGLAHQNAIAFNTDFGSFWYDEKDIYWYMGGMQQPQRIAAGRVRNWFNLFGSYLSDTFAVWNPKLNEYWIFMRIGEDDVHANRIILRYSPQFENFNVLNPNFIPEFADVSISGNIVISVSTAIGASFFTHTNEEHSEKLARSVAETHKIVIGDTHVDKILDEIFIEGKSEETFEVAVFVNDEETARAGNLKTLLSTLRRWVRALRAFTRVYKFSIRIRSAAGFFGKRPTISEFGVRFSVRTRRYGSR